MKEQLKKRLLDVGALALAGLLGIGGFYMYASIRAHQQLDAAILELIQASQPTSAPLEEVTQE